MGSARTGLFARVWRAASSLQRTQPQETYEPGVARCGAAETATLTALRRPTACIVGCCCVRARFTPLESGLPETTCVICRSCRLFSHLRSARAEGACGRGHADGGMRKGHAEGHAEGACGAACGAA